MVIFLVFVPVVQEVLNAISLLQKYTSTNFDPAVGAVIEREAEPVASRLPILAPTGMQRPVEQVT
jgi:hypothetical protein